MTQAELKAKYAAILARDVWHDQHMVDYCVKKAAHIVELDNGDIVAIDRPSIRKDFCFGYSDSRYNTDDYDRANDMAHYASKSVDYFMSENLKDINADIESLEGRNSSRYVFCIGIPYSGQPKESQLKRVYTIDRYRDDESKHTPLTSENRSRIVAGMKYTRHFYNMDETYFNDDLRQVVSAINMKKHAGDLQTYVSWKYRTKEDITWVGGIHSMYFSLNRKFLLEPRLAVRWQINDRQSVNAGFGQHSKTESIITYFTHVYNPDGSYTTPNTNLGLSKAHHYVVVTNTASPGT
jgi:hypothetical protein